MEETLHASAVVHASRSIKNNARAFNAFNIADEMIKKLSLCAPRREIAMDLQTTEEAKRHGADAHVVHENDVSAPEATKTLEK